MLFAVKLNNYYMSTENWILYNITDIYYGYSILCRIFFIASNVCCKIEFFTQQYNIYYFSYLYHFVFLLFLFILKIDHSPGWLLYIIFYSCFYKTHRCLVKNNYLKTIRVYHDQYKTKNQLFTTSSSTDHKNVALLL